MPGDRAKVNAYRQPTRTENRRAEARGTKPTALLRSWALEQLDAAGRGRERDRAAERWERDFRATSEHLRALLDERPGA